jgi:hypothetical protein
MGFLSDDLLSNSGFEIVNETSIPLPPGILMRGRGPIGITESENRNGRWYSNSFWSEVLGRPEVRSAIDERAMVGCADHPDSFVPPFPAISHIMTKSWLDESKNALMAEFEILDTPMGRILETLFRAKVKVGASTRAVGKTALKNGRNIVESKNYRWGGFDFVFEPSAQNAYPTPVEVKKEIEKIIAESSYSDIYSGNKEAHAETQKIYENVLNKFGIDSRLLLEKAPDLSVEDILPSAMPMQKHAKYLFSLNENLDKENTKLSSEIEESNIKFSELRIKLEEKESTINKLKLKLKELAEGFLKLPDTNERGVSSDILESVEANNKSLLIAVEAMSNQAKALKEQNIVIQSKVITEIVQDPALLGNLKSIKEKNLNLIHEKARLVIQSSFNQNQAKSSVMGITEHSAQQAIKILGFQSDIKKSQLEVQGLKEQLKVKSMQESIQMKEPVILNKPKFAKKIYTGKISVSPINESVHSDKVKNTHSQSMLSILNNMNKGR